MAFLALKSLEQIKSIFIDLYSRHRTKKEVKYILKHYDDISLPKYIFSKMDVNLFIEERCVKLFPAQRIKDYDGYSLVRISEEELFWPNNLSGDSLPWLYHEIFDDWSQNPSSYNHPEFNVNDVNWIIDAGAAEGFYSMYVLKKHFKGRLIAVEPLEIMCNVLRLSLSNRDNSIRYEVVGKALGREAGYCYVNQEQDACDSFTSDTPMRNNEQSVSIQQTTIDSLIEEYSLDGRGIIKMDIEGYEMKALQGAEKTITTLKPKLAVAVYHGYENAMECANIVRSFRNDYSIEFRGMYAYFDPPRPYLMFAY